MVAWSDVPTWLSSALGRQQSRRCGSSVSSASSSPTRHGSRNASRLTRSTARRSRSTGDGSCAAAGQGRAGAHGRGGNNSKRPIRLTERTAARVPAEVRLLTERIASTAGLRTCEGSACLPIPTRPARQDVAHTSGVRIWQRLEHDLPSGDHGTRHHAPPTSKLANPVNPQAAA